MRILGCFNLSGRAARATALMAASARARPTAKRINPEGSPLILLVDETWADIGWTQAPDGSLAIVDGEVYELPGGLRPADAKEAAAAILQAYQRSGRGILAEINCGAALAIWDAGERRLILAGDRGGLGLCYIMESEGALFWSSDMLPLIELDGRTALHTAAVDNMLAGGFVPTPWTILAHIRKLPPAYLLDVDSRGSTLARYWLPPKGAKADLSAEEIQTELDQLMFRSVQRRLPRPQKSAMLLSGGVDSALLLAYLTLRCNAEVESYTYRYADYDGPYNEGERARRVAEFCRSPHHEIVFRPADLVQQLDRILLDHKGPLSYGVHTSILDPITAAGTEVLFGGHGADSFFYSRTEQIGLALSRYPRFATQLLSGCVNLLSHVRPSLSTNFEYAAFIAETGLTWRFRSPLTPEHVRAGLYADPSAMPRSASELTALVAPMVAEFAELPASDRIPLVTQRFTTALHWTQSFARGAHMVARCPYMDTDLVDFLFSLPRPPGKKGELRALAAKLLNPELASVPKIGQTLPMRSWLRGPLAEFLRERLSVESIEAAGLFRADAVRRLMERHLRAEGDHHWTLWILLGIVEFHRIVSERAGRIAALADRTTSAA